MADDMVDEVRHVGVQKGGQVSEEVVVVLDQAWIARDEIDQ
jgi:hypothetical protein